MDIGLGSTRAPLRRRESDTMNRIRHTHHLKNQGGQVLPEQAFILTAIAGIALFVVLRLGFETSSMFDHVSRTFPGFSESGSGKRPAGKRPKPAPSTLPSMAASGTPAPGP